MVDVVTIIQWNHMLYRRKRVWWRVSRQETNIRRCNKLMQFRNDKHLLLRTGRIVYASHCSIFRMIPELEFVIYIFFKKSEMHDRKLGSTYAAKSTMTNACEKHFLPSLSKTVPVGTGIFRNTYTRHTKHVHDKRASYHSRSCVHACVHTNS